MALDVKEERLRPAREAYAARVDVGCRVEDLNALADSGWKAGAISADPNWTFKTRSDEGRDRSPDQHYETDALETIKALPVDRLAAATHAQAHDAEAVGLHVMLHETGNVCPLLAGLHVLDRQVQRATGDVEQFLFLRRDRADRNRDRGIAAIAFVAKRHIEGDDITGYSVGTKAEHSSCGWPPSPPG